MPPPKVHSRKNCLLYLITNRRAFLLNDGPNEGQIEAIERAARAGCQLIQIREKDLSARALTDFVRRAIDVARPHGARVLVNDRLDVALAAGADGVHLRVNSLPPEEVRRVVSRKDFLLGVSTHSLAEIQTAEHGGADFAVYGPVYDTTSKREYGAPLGPRNLARVCKATNIPVLAIGGVNLGNFREVLHCGAAGIAAIGIFTDLDCIEQNVQRILGAAASNGLTPQAD